MRKIVLILSLLAISFSQLWANSPEELFPKANEYYQNADYNKAIELYEQILDNGYKNSEIYYNLANSYYKNKEIAPAILNYERALKLNPGDEDIIFNLKLSNLRTVDKFEIVPEIFIIEWYHSLSSIFSSGVWGLISIIMIAAVALFIGIFLASASRDVKKLSFLSGNVFAFLFVISIVFALNEYSIENDDSIAIIFEKNVVCYTSPDKTSTKAFALHEGTKVNITDELDSWYEIKLPDGNVAWIEKKSLQKV